MIDNNLVAYRHIKSITQQKLADSIGVSRQTIINIENYTFLPSLELAFKLAHFFNCKIDNLFYER